MPLASLLAFLPSAENRPKSVPVGIAFWKAKSLVWQFLHRKNAKFAYRFRRRRNLSVPNETYFSNFYIVKMQIRENNFQLFLSRSPLPLAFLLSWVSFYFAPSSIWCLLSPRLDTPILLLTCYRDSDTTPSPSPQLGDSQSPNYLRRPRKATIQHNYWCYPSLATSNMMQQAAKTRHETSEWEKSKVLEEIKKGATTYFR